MNILMMTNTYKPLIGGLEKSVETFTKEYRKLGHRVIIVAPVFENMKPEEDVVRIPAIQNFNGTDFSVQLPVPGVLSEALGDFIPDIVHSHHPFLVGDTALRVAHKHNVPMVFTHHTLYEQNLHYVPGDSEALKRFVIQLSSGYANLADLVFAPSESVMDLLKERGVETPIEVVPTGIDVRRFSRGDERTVRTQLGIPQDVFVVGHLGRLSPEKNLEFMSEAVALFLRKNPRVHFLLAGKGPSEPAVISLFKKYGVSERLHLTGPVTGETLVQTYHAMDVFVFTSQSETQGLVLVEAMACGVPVVGVDASGVRDVIVDRVNGRLLPRQQTDDLTRALEWMAERSSEELEKITEACLNTAETFSIEKTVRRALDIYGSLALSHQRFVRRVSEDSVWAQTRRMIQAHWELTKNLTKATTEAILKTPEH